MCTNVNLFLRLLKPEYNDALKYCKALCSKHSLDDAEDVLQQSLLKALENFGSLKDNSKFRSWFFKIITNEFFNFIRKSFWKRFLPLESVPAAAEIPEVFDRDDEDENRMILNKVLQKISPKEKSALLLYEVGGFSIEEIKEMQNEKSISAIKSRLSRTREKLRKLIVNEESNFLKSKNKSSNHIGDINNETIKFIREIEAK